MRQLMIVFFSLESFFGVSTFNGRRCSNLIRSRITRHEFLKKGSLLKVGVLLYCVLMNSTVFAQSPRGGIFIPRNGAYEARIGESHVVFQHNQGGIMQVVAQEWPQFKALANTDMVFSVKVQKKEIPVEVRQSFDKDPQIFFLEEGNERIGLRVLFKLYSADNIYHGNGMTETWLYPNGEMFVTAAAMFENSSTNPVVKKAHLAINIPKTLKDTSFETRKIPLLGRDSGDRQLFLTPSELINGKSKRLSLFWRTGRMEYNTVIPRVAFGNSGAPYYFRWPDYPRQAYAYNLTLPSGFESYVDEITTTDEGVNLNWSVGKDPQKTTTLFKTFFRLAMVTDEVDAKALILAESQPIEMDISGGMIHGYNPQKDDKSTMYGYNDQEGCYEIRKFGEEPLVITLPTDTLLRTVRIKAIALAAHGAITATLDGKPLVPQLTTDGGIADDPLAPIRQSPEAPANAAMVTVKLTDKPQVLKIQEQEGIQLVYQSRDPQRNYMIYSTKTGPRWSGLRFSLIDGRARNMRAYGEQDWALGDNLLHWFPYGGYTPEHMINELRDFIVVKNGPDEIIFKYTSENPNGGARSEYIVSSRADSPAMQINVGATFTILDQWTHDNAQFFDIFPFRGVEPRDWWYDSVLWLTPEGRWKTSNTFSGKEYGDKKLEQITGPGFFGLFSSDRGNMLMLTKNFTPELPAEYVLCGNYIDYHMTVKFGSANMLPLILKKGFKQSVDYELAVWGDKNLTRDQLIEIGKRSLKEGKLTFPKE